MTKWVWQNTICCKQTGTDDSARGFAVLGLSKFQKYDMKFEEVPQVPTTMAAGKGLLYSPQYHFYPYKGTNKSQRLPKGLSDIMTQDDFEILIFNELHRLQNMANQRIRERGILLERNPCRLLSGKVGRWLSYQLHAIIDYLVEKICCGSDLMALPITIPLIYLYLSVLLCAYCFTFLIVDLWTGKLYQIGSPQDLAYIHNVMKENPFLDTKKIDEDIQQGLHFLGKQLQRQFPHYHIYVEYDVEWVREGKRIEAIDLFLLCFQKHSSSSIETLSA
jgi:hypothetical protein